MKRPVPHALLGLLLANAAGVLLLCATLQWLAAAGPVSAAANGRPHLVSGLAIGLTVDTGTGEPNVAFNGEVVTYTIRLTNTSGAALNNVQVLDTLPPDTLANIQCFGAWQCTHLYEEQTIPEPLGGTLLVTVTRQLTWTVASIANGATALLQFTGRVAGQADGTVVNNVASVLRVNGAAVSGLTANVNATVRVRIGNLGHAQLSNAATWFSTDLGGTLSQDWGDINRDGYMDLVLGSSVGTSVFVNENGRLRKLWSVDKRTYGVRFGDFNNDGRLDVVAVGDSEDGLANKPGTSYIYGQFTDPVTLSPTFGTSATFGSDYQLVRVGVGDFDRDNDVDVVASTNSINAPCPVQLFRNDGTGHFTAAPMCLSTVATAAIGPGDYDNDGDLDLALGLFPDTIKIFINHGGVFTETDNPGQPNTAIVDDSLPFLPYDFAWGDYTADGKLDLAAAFPLQKEARVFRNKKGLTFDPEPFDTAPSLVFRTASFLTPLAVDWGDFNGDGRLDLLVADEAPRVYLNQGGTGSFLPSAVLASDTQLGQKWGLRGAQLDFGGDLSLAVTNRDRASLLLEGFGSHLANGLSRLNTDPASSVAWGDSDNDGDLDLLLGAGDGALGATVYYNFGGAISNTNSLKLAFSGIGPHNVAFGDVDGNRRLEIGVATPGGAQLYQPGATQPYWTADAASHVAFTDANSDGRLDMLAATAGGGISLYLNQNGQLSTVPAFTTAEVGEVRGLAVADFNRDFYPDFAVAFANAPARVFINNKNNSFTSVWNSQTQHDTRAVAWGDFNIDGYPDLAVGHYQQGTVLYQNLTGTLTSSPVWTSSTISKTTALAWGDWDSDGYPDLAVGNHGEPSQVFANLHSEYNLPRLYWLWSSLESYATTDLAWGDVDGDGDLDLGYSQGGGGFNGYYRNGTILPSHHFSVADDYLRTMPLANNPPYVAVPRPGDTSMAYQWSSSEILGLGNSPTVTIVYRQYDPDGARQAGETAGDPLARTFFEFSLDGGATWKRASGVTGAAPAITATTRAGVLSSFVWDARKDKAISDDARFRIRVVPQLTHGPTQRASTISISPPFRIRALAAGCVWPDNPTFLMSPNPPVAGVTTYLTGSVSLGATGPLTYSWQFSDQVTPTLGQIATHQFSPGTSFAVTMTVTGPACPTTRPVVITQIWSPPPAGPLLPRAYLPYQSLNPPAAASGAGETVSEPTASPEPTAPEPTATETSAPATATSEPIETATSEPPTPEATQTATEAPSPTTAPDPTATETPPTSGGGLARGWAPLAGSNINLSQGQPTLRTVSAERPAAASTPSLIFITTPGTIGISNEPTISSDGKHVAFWSTADLVPSVGNSDGNIELFVALKGSPVQFTQVTVSSGSILGGFNLSPSMDDSGTRVAFFSDRNLIGQNPEHSFQVYLYDSTSLSLTQVTTRTRGFNILPSLSGDGQYIAFVSDRNYGAETDGISEAEGNSEIALARLGAEGTITITQVTTTTNQSNDQPRIDFDGDRIVFVSTADLVPGQNPENNREVFVALIQPDGSVQYTQLTTTELGTTGQVSISGNGRYVAFVSDQDPDGDGPVNPPCVCSAVYVAELNGAGQLVAMQLASNNNTEIGLTQPSISADGTRVAYIAADNEQLILHDVVSSADTAIDVAGNSRNPVISAGGTAVAFASEKQILWAEFPLAELSITKTVAPQVGFPGELLRYTIVVSNAGPSLATGVVVTDVLASTALSFTTTPDQIDNSSGAGGFGAAGSNHNNTTYSASPPAGLTLQSGSAGVYTSRVMDAGSPAPWTRLAWTPVRPYGKPLPNNGASESAYHAGNASLTDAAALLHFDEAPGAGSFVNSASTVAAPGTCTTSGACPQAGQPGQFNSSVLFAGSPNHLNINILPTGGDYATAFWFATDCGDCGLMQVGRGTLGNAQRDRQILLSGGRVCAHLSGEAICTTGVYSDSQWHHVAHVYGNPAQAGGVQQLYVDGVLQAVGVVTAPAIVDDAVINVGYAMTDAVAGFSPHYVGRLDELALFARSLSGSEIEDLYLRGALQLLFQARTCALADCSDGGAFSGPGGSPSTYYSEASNGTAGLPEATLENLAPQRYFQYQALLATSNGLYQPRVQRVEIGPSHGAIETHQGFCSNPTFGASSVGFTCNLNDMEAGETATVTVSLTPTTYGALTNTAGVTSDVDEHDPVNVASATPDILPLPIQVFTLNLAGVPGAAGTGHTFTATVGPVTASVPITYIWQATNQTTFVRSSGLTSTAVLTWFTGGPQVVTVTAINAANVLSGTPGLSATLALTVTNPVPQLTALSQTFAPIDSGPVTLVVTGSQFAGNAQVRWNTTETLATTFGSSTRLTATVPVTLLQTAGDFPVRVFNPGPGGGLSPQTITFTVSYPTPTDLALNPSTATAGTSGFALVVTGNNFYSTATLYWNGSPRTTVVNTATQTLTATILTSDLTSVATRAITVTNGPPSTGPSAASTFTITALGLTLEPPSVTMGLDEQAVVTATISDVQAAARTLTLGASNSTVTVPASRVISAGATQVTFTVTSGGLGGLATVTGTLPAAQGGAQDTVNVAVFNPTPVITGTNPITATAGGMTLTGLQIYATDVVTGVQVYWNGTLLPSSLTGGVISAQVSSSLINLAGTATITAVNPMPNTGISAPVTFTIAQPTISLIPTSVTTTVNAQVRMTVTANAARANATVITLASSNGSVASVPGSVTIPAGSATAAFTMTAGAIGGSANVTATLPAAYGAGSASSSIVVNNSAPVISQLSPSIVQAGSGDFTLIITGTGFVNNSQVLHDGTAFSNSDVDFINATRLEVDVAGSIIASAGYISITVHNNPPPAGGLTSGVAILEVRNPAPTITAATPTTATVGGPAFTLSVTGTNFINGAQVYFGGQPHNATVISSTRLTTTITAADIDTIGSTVITMTNPAPAYPSPSSRPFTVTQLGLSLAPTGTFTRTAGTSTTLTVTLSAVQAGPTVVTVTAATPSVATIPPTVTVPAGQLALSFAITTTNPGTTDILAELPANLGGDTGTNTLVVVDAPLAGLVVTNGGPRDLVGATVSMPFTATLTSGSNPTFQWNWGDGTPVSTGPQATRNHTYSGPLGGIYTVVVTATNAANTLTATTIAVVNNVTPTLTSMSPLTFPVGSPARTLVLTGTRFVTGTVVNINGVPRVGNTQPLTPTVMTVTLTAADLDTAGTFTVSVSSPTPPTPPRESEEVLSFRVLALSASNNGPKDVGTPVVLTAVITPSVTLSYTWLPGDGSGPFTGGSVFTHSYPSSIGGVYTAVVTATAGATGPVTATTIVTMNNLTPTITAFSPITRSGNSGFTMTITGTNFVTGMQIEWQDYGPLIATTVVSSTQLTASIPGGGGGAIPNAGAYTFKLLAPAPPAIRRESLPQIFVRT